MQRVFITIMFRVFGKQTLRNAWKEAGEYIQTHHA